ncbi:MAG TPA: chorismate mutase [Lachnospiraceae bacterium]|nr:chorismate mutase [Lachnospiraceae bacterium]
MEVQTLTEVRREIDEIDPEIRELLMRRLDCSRKVAHAKLKSGDITIYRADREKEILKRLGNEVPDDRRDGYLAVVRKIMETSRMYQYGIIYDRLEGVFEKISEGIEIPENADRVKILLTRPNRPNAMSSILAMIGDYGYNMEKMLLIKDDAEKGTVTFELTILGDLNTEHMKKLMFQLSMESGEFRILEVR